MSRKLSTAKKPTMKTAAVHKASQAVPRPSTEMAAKTTETTGRKLTALRKPMTKTQLYTAIAENTNLAKKDVAAVFDELSLIINHHIKKRGVGAFILPGLFKATTIKKPAQKARKNVPNPFKPGEIMDIAAKPARTVIKIRPLKKLKDMTA